MKTQEELNVLKEEVENMNKKLAELTEEELKQVIGGAAENSDQGIITDWCPFCGECVDYYMIKKYNVRYREFWHCGKCGDLTYFKKEGRWEHGIILD